MSKNVYILCLGRLANQLLAWANGRHATSALPNRKLILNYAPLIGACTMPNTEIVDYRNPPAWHSAKTVELASMPGHCVWTEAWENHPPRNIVQNYLRQIEFAPTVLQAVDTFINNQPHIGVHLRYGDYVALDENNPPMIRPPFVRAPNHYYSNALDACLASLPGYQTVLCTDGTEPEVAWFVDKYKPKRQPKNSGLIDLLTLSRCRIVIASASTFGTLAASLKDVPCIHPETSPDRIPALIESAK